MFPKSEITIFVSQRNGRKTKTHVYGWGEEYDLHKICAYFKKVCKCGGAVVTNKEYGLTIELSGDNKKDIYDFLIGEEICVREDITIRGI
jgi:translation initiation factor SUI1